MLDCPGQEALLSLPDLYVHTNDSTEDRRCPSGPSKVQADDDDDGGGGDDFCSRSFVLLVS